MKRAIAIATAAMLTLPVVAAEKEQPKPADSPLVAAAKKTNRSGKKSIVITNDDVKTSKGRITTTTVVRQVYVPDPVPTPEMLHAQAVAKQREVAAEKAAKAEVERKAAEAKLARAAAAAEDGDDPYSDADPATADKKP